MNQSRTGKVPKGGRRGKKTPSDQSNTREPEQEIHLNNFSRKRLFMYEMLMRVPLREPVSA